MLFGAYVCLSAILVIPGLLLLTQMPHQRAAYLLKSAVLSAGALALFSGASILTGLMRIGIATTYRYPQDYIDYGPVGWVILVLLPLGVISPLYLAWRLHRKGLSV